MKILKSTKMFGTFILLFRVNATQLCTYRTNTVFLPYEISNVTVNCR